MMLRLYDFSCVTCGYTFEDIVRAENGVIEEMPLCPKCKKETVRVPSVCNFRFQRIRFDSVANRWDYSGVEQ